MRAERLDGALKRAEFALAELPTVEGAAWTCLGDSTIALGVDFVWKSKAGMVLRYMSIGRPTRGKLGHHSDSNTSN